MSTLLKMAWRNLWRNKRRTVILLCAMMAGLVGVLFSIGLTNSWLIQIKDNAVRTFEGHIKIHARGFFDRPVIENTMPGLGPRLAGLAADPRVVGVAERIVLQGLLSTASQSRIITVVGIDTAAESSVSTIPGAVGQGVYLDDWERPGKPVLIGRRLAERIERGLGKKIVLMAQRYGDNEVGSAAFRIAGIFDSGNDGFDEAHVYIRGEDAQAMMGLGTRVTEAVVMLGEIEDSDLMAPELAARLDDPALEVLSWRERMPFVDQTIEMTRQMMIPYYAVFYLAMAFGIVNTLLMAVGERSHEIGVMMAIGMNRHRMIALILIESFMTAAVAVALGSLVGCGIIAWFGARGIDLSALAEGLAYMGVSRVIYPELRVVDVVGAGLAGFAVALLVALYPAWRASRLAPVEAIREIT